MTRPHSLADLLRVMERLRDPQNGCPWDIEQTFQSIVPSTLEECYELAQAIEQEDYPHVAEELGDVLFQVIFYAQLGREQNLFSFDDVVDGLVNKLLRRHPHVFAQGEIEGVVDCDVSVAEVAVSWESIKQDERHAKSQRSLLADVPVALPALPRAQKLQKRAAGANFDWRNADGVLAKLEEEIAQLRQAMAEGDGQAMENELGDVLFTGVNIARHLGLNAEASLRKASSRFELRFQRMESLAADAGTALEALNEEAQNVLWEQAKRELSTLS